MSHQVGGGFATGGKRISLPHTRGLIRQAIKGDLLKAPMEKDHIFGFFLPVTWEGVPSEILKPANAWNDEHTYYSQARRLAEKFVENFSQFSGDAPREVLEAGPKIEAE